MSCPAWLTIGTTHNSMLGLPAMTVSSTRSPGTFCTCRHEFILRPSGSDLNHTLLRACATAAAVRPAVDSRCSGERPAASGGCADCSGDVASATAGQDSRVERQPDRSRIVGESIRYTQRCLHPDLTSRLNSATSHCPPGLSALDSRIRAAKTLLSCLRCTARLVLPASVSKCPSRSGMTGVRLNPCPCAV